MPELLVLLLLFLAGVGAGFINAMAGSGSLLTLPALMLGGLDAALANGSNRLGILIQSLFTLKGYASMGLRPDRATWWGVLPVLVGAVAGAFLTQLLDRGLFRYVIDVVMVGMLVLVSIKQSSWLRPQATTSVEVQHKAWVVALMFAAGVYAGFIQVGSGYVMMAVMVLVGGMDLYRANIVKVVAQLANAVAVLPIYIYLGEVAWKLAIVLAVGFGLGGWLGARFAVRVGAKWIRYVLILGLSLYLLKEAVELLTA